MLPAAIFANVPAPEARWGRPGPALLPAFEEETFLAIF
ncbi:hypothetical protein DVDV_2313 [Desulfovibrio sp. DV]|nr:hypothetical protein DVDV_2313 [Desulfovibrio sp. DV]